LKIIMNNSGYLCRFTLMMKRKISKGLNNMLLTQKTFWETSATLRINSYSLILKLTKLSKIIQLVGHNSRLGSINLDFTLFSNFSLFGVLKEHIFFQNCIKDFVRNFIPKMRFHTSWTAE
jgi:hypothetical protein